MRLGFSVAAHIQADVLLLDEVFAVGDEEFQRKCFGKIHEFKRRGGTIVFVSHDAQAVERLCDRAVLLRQGSVVFDGDDARGDRRSTGGCSPTTRSPDELAAGLREWGSGEARIVSAQAARRRRRRAASVRGRRAGRRRADRRLRARRRRRRSVSLELRDDDGVVLGGVSAGDRRARLGRPAPASASSASSSTGCRSPTGRFHLRCALVGGDGGRLLHSSTTPSASSSSRPARETGAVLLDGRWSMQEIGASAPIATAHELAHLPRLAAADGDRPRAPVQALHAARGAAAGRRARRDRGARPRRGRDLLRPRRATSSTPSTPTRRSPRRCARRTGSTCASGSSRSPGSNIGLAAGRPPHCRASRAAVVSRATCRRSSFPSAARRARAASGRSRRTPARHLARAMLADVLAACAAVGPTFVVAPAGAGRSPAPPLVVDPGGGQGAAVRAALDAAVLATGGAGAVPRRQRRPAVRHAARPARARRRGPRRRARARPRQPTGRRTRSRLASPDLFAPVYGPGSAARFAALGPSRDGRRAESHR